NNVMYLAGILGENIECVIHTLQLIIHNCIFKNQKFIHILRKCQKIIEHFNQSLLAYLKLSSIQKTLKLPNHKLIYDDTTRWNSTFCMLLNLHEQRQAITAHAADRDIPTFTVMQWSIVEQKDAGIVMLKEELKKAMEERLFNSAGFKDRKCFVLATVLHPRFKIKILSDENKASQWIITELLEINNTVVEDINNTVIEDINNTQSNISSRRKKNFTETRDDIWKCFDDIINNSSSVLGLIIGVSGNGNEGYPPSPTSIPSNLRSLYRIYIREFWNMRLSCSLPGHSGTMSNISVGGPTTTYKNKNNYKYNKKENMSIINLYILNIIDMLILKKFKIYIYLLFLYT
ncbi:Zinc finger BED domain-containing protein 4, partial [Cyphomyrmex costatus]